MLDDYQSRKAERKRKNDAQLEKIRGTVKIHLKCFACNGTGIYDNTGSPKCGSCNGTGTETRRVKPEEVEKYKPYKKYPYPKERR